MLIFLWVGLIVFLGERIENYWLFNNIVLTPLSWERLWDVFWLVIFYGRAVQHRRFGGTVFAHAKSYLDVHLTDQHRKEYFRDGITVVRNAFRPELLTALRKELTMNFGLSNSIWSHYRSYDSDALADFYAYSNLGHIAAELFKTPGTHTAEMDSRIYLWRDFHYVRHPSTWLSTWHPDAEDCDILTCPTTWTRCQRPRILVPLTDFYQGPIFTNVSYMEQEVLSPEQRDKQLRGELVAFPSITDSFDFVAHMATGEASKGFIQFPTRLGDVVVHVPCSMHSSPLPQSRFHELALFPTFAHGSSSSFDEDLYVRSCIRQHLFGTVYDNRDCFLQVFPPAERPHHGSVRTFKHWGNVFGWLGCTIYNQTINGALQHAVNGESCRRKGF